jgi:hypothetical protein
MRKEFWWGSLGERENLENLGVDGRIILKWFFETRKEVVDWIDLFKTETDDGIL